MARGFLDEDAERDDVHDGDSSDRHDVEVIGFITRHAIGGFFFKDLTRRRDLFVPKSVLRRHEFNLAKNLDRLTLPEWFAKKEGLI